MLSKCANPDCSASFRYLHSGKLYRFEAWRKPEPNQDFGRKPNNSVEFFWLCDECASNYKLISDPIRGTCLTPLPKRVIAAAS